MKNYRILLIILFFPLIMSCQPGTEEAIKYNDVIIEQQNLVNEKFSALISSYDSYVPEDMSTAYTNALDQLNMSIEYVKQLKGFEEDAYFKESALVYFNTYKDALENEHKRIIELYNLPDDDYNAEQVKELEKLRNQGSKKTDKAIDDMLTVQEKFAKKYHIEFEK